MRSFVKSYKLHLAVFLAGLCFYAEARAEESDKVRRVRYESELEKEAEATDAKCKTKIQTSIDWASFEADPRWADKSVSSYCSNALSALRRFCEGDKARAHIQKTVKKLNCKAVKGKADWRLVVKDGSLDWLTTPEAVNADDFARNQLLRVL